MIKVDFSLKECMIMIGMLKSDMGSSNQLTISRIASAVGVSLSNTRLWNVVRYLTDIEIIKHIDQVGSCKIIKIDKIKLEELVNLQEILIPIFKFYEDQHTLVV